MRIFFDMDGTLAEWKPLVLNAEEDIQAALNIVLGKPGYYKNLKLHENIRTLLYSLIDEYETYTLSCYRPNTYSCDSYGNSTPLSTPLRDKNWWLDKKVSRLIKYHRIFVPDGRNKSEYLNNTYGVKLTKEDILIDDYPKNLKEWTLAGGTAVKCLNGINSPDKAYQSVSIYGNYEKGSEDLSEFLTYLNSIQKETTYER